MARNNSSKRSNSLKNKKQNYIPKNLVGGFIRGDVQQYAYGCGTNPLAQYHPYDLFNGCSGNCSAAPVQNAGGKRNNSRKLNRKSNLYYRYI
jgi:hypothetical protein